MASITRFAAETAAKLSDIGGNHQLVLEIFLHDRLAHRLDGPARCADPPVERLQGNLAISVPALSQIAAVGRIRWTRAEMESVKHGYEENRRTLLAGLPKIGFDKILPVDGAFYLYADVSRFCSDSYDFAKRLLAQTHVAVTPGIDFDPLNGHFIRLCYAGSREEMQEAMERIGELAQTAERRFANPERG